MITIDKTLVIHIINMLVLMYVLNKVLYKPIQDILLKRQGKLETLAKDVERFEQNAAHRQQEVDRKMREASNRAKQALDGARGEANAAGAAKLAEIRSQTDGEKEKQLADINSQVQAARKELEGKVGEFAGEMAGKILGRGVEA